ncbi:MAG: hypothetical protein LBU30_04960 [Candidatus Methanoplasma sp.]|jgi:ABC-type Fe3+-hydroxamate transport system substrate-binding protein|nr:hypothetical protein [Candidatus Methanoplasma sp.]
MLETKKIVAILVVVAVIAAGIGVAWSVLKDNKERVNIDAALEVYGNANNDGRIDQADSEIITDIMLGKKSLEDYPLADADCNGTVDGGDVVQLGAIINATAEKKVNIYHINHFDGKDEIAETMYPITSAVATGAANTILIFKYLGIVDEIKGFSWAGAPDDFLFSEYRSLITSDKRLETSATRMNLEKVSELVDRDGVSAVITADNRTYVTNSGEFEAMGVDVVRVTPAAVDSRDYMQTVLMIAFLFDTDGKGYMNKCMDLIGWYEDFFTDLNDRLGDLKNRVTAVTSSSDRAISSSTSDYTDVLMAAGAVFPIDKEDWAGSSSKNFNPGDTWIYNYDIDYLIPIRTSVAGAFSWYEGTAVTGGSNTLKGYMNIWNTLECYRDGNVYVVCGDMPVVLRIAYVAQILYPDVFGEDFAYGYHLDFVEKFFGWDEDMIKGKPFYVSMSDVGITV